MTSYFKIVADRAPNCVQKMTDNDCHSFSLILISAVFVLLEKSLNSLYFVFNISDVIIIVNDL